MKLCGQTDPRIETWLKRKTNKYVSHDIQNKLLKILALSVLREIATAIAGSDFFLS